MNNVTRNKTYAKRRRGAVLSEALVSAAILLAGIGIVARSHSNLTRLWGDTRHFQLASDELCNQLDRLTRLPKENLAESLRDLQVSPEIAGVLPECRIEGSLIDDPLGSRVQLKIDWKRVGTGKPLELTGWLRATDKVIVEQSASDTSPPATSDPEGKE